MPSKGAGAAESKGSGADAAASTKDESKVAAGATIEPTKRTTIKRLPDRQVTDKARIYGVLDDGVVCHVAMVAHGSPIIIPTGYVRFGDFLYLHGKSNSMLMKALASGEPTCVTVTHLDGFVISRSAFNHSVNYRSVVVLGSAELVSDVTEKTEALKWFVDGLIPGRWEGCRQPTKAEITATSVVRLALTEASCKIRTGEPHDDACDMDGPYWAGLIPMAHVSFPATTAKDLADGVAMPDHIRDFDRVTPVQRHPFMLEAQAAHADMAVGGASAQSSGAPMWLVYILGIVLAMAFTRFVGSQSPEL